VRRCLDTRHQKGWYTDHYGHHRKPYQKPVLPSSITQPSFLARQTQGLVGLGSNEERIRNNLVLNLLKDLFPLLSSLKLRVGRKVKSLPHHKRLTRPEKALNYDTFLPLAGGKLDGIESVGHVNGRVQKLHPSGRSIRVWLRLGKSRQLAYEIRDWSLEAKLKRLYDLRCYPGIGSVHSSFHQQIECIWSDEASSRVARPRNIKHSLCQLDGYQPTKDAVLHLSHYCSRHGKNLHSVIYSRRNYFPFDKLRASLKRFILNINEGETISASPPKFSYEI